MRTIERFFLGIDVSKGYADFHLMDEHKQRVEKGFQLDDNLPGHQILQKLISKYTRDGKTLICGIENTGGYEQNWVELLKKMTKTEAVEIYKLNPKAVKHQIASHLKRTINDGVSAEGIAEYVANNHQKYKENWTNSTYRDSSETSMQQYFRFIISAIKQQTARYNQMEKLLYQNFPESLSFCKNGIPDWLLRMLCKYPSASNVRKVSIERLDAIRGITDKKAMEIKELAKNSVAKQSLPFDQIMIKDLAETILHHERKIDSLKQMLIDAYKNDSVLLIKTIRGIGDWTAVSVALFLGNISRFKDTNQLAAFFGVNPVHKESGDGKWGVRMSKQGSKHMRALLFVAANNVILHDPYFRNLYQKYLATGKKPKVVKGIIMHKLLRVIYGMLKNQMAYNAQVDTDNQEKHAAIEVKLLPLSLSPRRYQDISTHAPVSRSNLKKRRAVIECLMPSGDTYAASSPTALEQK